MSPEILLLCGSAATIAFVHTLLGPDHYLPFVAMAKSRGWSLGQTVRTTLLCGAGHIVGSVVLGLAGVFVGVRLGTLEWIEGLRGDLAAWALVSFGLVYMAWGLRRAWRNRPHAHWHSHGEVRHYHSHDHHREHAHVHGQEAGQRSLAGWAIFLVFILGPCEPLIPILMFPAAKQSVAAMLAVTSVFAVVTVLTMLLAVVAASAGLRQLRLPSIERYSDALAGGTITLCGLGIAVLGL